MRIAISGAQSTGKSTLLAALRAHPKFKDFVVRDETTRNVLRGVLGVEKMEINENGTDDTQRLIIAQHLANSINAHGPNVLYDRCALDGVVYTHYLYMHNKVSKQTFRIAQSIFENVRYDIWFYIPPEFEPIRDGERSVNTEFRDDIVKLFDEYIASYGIPTVNLSGTVEERVAQVIRIMEESNEAM